MMSAFDSVTSGVWMRRRPPSTPAFVASAAMRLERAMYSGRQSG